MPQDRQCLPYPHSTGPWPTRLGGGPHGAGRRRVIAGSTQVGHLHPAGRSTVRGAPPLSASQAYLRAARAPGRARANRCCVPTTAEGDSDGSHWDDVPTRPAYPGSPSGTSEPPGRTGLRQPSGAPGTAGASSSSESPTILRTLAICLQARMARTTSRPNR